MNTFEKYLLLKGTILGVAISSIVISIYMITNLPNKGLFEYIITLLVLALIIDILIEKWAKRQINNGVIE